MPQLIKNIKGEVLPNLIGQIKLASVEGIIQSDGYVGMNGFIAFLQDYSKVIFTDTIKKPINFGVKAAYQSVTVNMSYNDIKPSSIPLAACRYSLPDRALWINANLEPPYSYTLDSIMVNGDEYITDPNTIIIIPPVTVTTINGIENFSEIVDWMNEIFESVGLVNYRAQLSYKTPSLYGGAAEFYIIRPVADTFSINISALNNFNFTYTNNNLYLDGYPTGGLYYNFSCSGITIENGEITNNY